MRVADPGAHDTEQPPYVQIAVDDVISRLDDREYCIIPSLIQPARADEIGLILAGIRKAQFKDSYRKCAATGNPDV